MLQKIRVLLYGDVDRKLGELLSAVQRIERNFNKLMLDFNQLAAEVANNTKVEASAEKVIQTLADEIAALNANNGDPTTQAKIDDFVAALRANNTTLAASVAANTAPVVVVPPAPLSSTGGQSATQ